MAWRLGSRKAGGSGGTDDDGGDPSKRRRIDGRNRRGAGRRRTSVGRRGLHLADVDIVFAVRRGVADLDFAGGPRSEGGFVVDGREERSLAVLWLGEEGTIDGLGLGEEKRRNRRRRRVELSQEISLRAAVVKSLSQRAGRTILIIDGVFVDVVHWCR